MSMINLDNARGRQQTQQLQEIYNIPQAYDNWWQAARCPLHKNPTPLSALRAYTRGQARVCSSISEGEFLPACVTCREEDGRLVFAEYLTNKRAFITEQLTNEIYDRHLLSLVNTSVFSNLRKLKTRHCPHLLLRAVLWPMLHWLILSTAMPTAANRRKLPQRAKLAQTDGRTPYRFIHPAVPINACRQATNSYQTISHRVSSAVWFYWNQFF